MKIEVTEVPTRRVFCIRHVGPYQEIGSSFGALMGQVQSLGLPMGPVLGLYHDDPGSVAPDQLRSDAAVVLTDDSLNPAPEKEAPEKGEFHVQTLTGGKYVVAHYVGSYEGLGAAWGEFMERFQAEGHEFREGTAFEDYVDDCDHVPVEQLRTDLYLAAQ